MSNLPPWTIAIFGTATYIEPNDESEVDLSALDTTDPMIDIRWKKFQIRGIQDRKEQLNDIENYNNSAVHTKGQKRLFTIDFDALYFPVSMIRIEDLENALNNQWIYFFKGEYDFPDENYRIHADGKCLLVAASSSIEFDYEDGRIDLALNMQTVNARL